MAQNYDNMAKYLTTNYGDDISQFILGTQDCEILEHLDTEQQVIIGQRTDAVLRIRINGDEAILHIEFQTQSSREPMWTRIPGYQGWAEACVQSVLTGPFDAETKADLLSGLTVLGSITQVPDLFTRFIPEELMQESGFYRYLQDKFTRENTIENTLALLEDQFQAETISMLKPALLKITDIQHLKQILRAARNIRDVDAFSELLHKE